MDLMFFEVSAKPSADASVLRELIISSASDPSADILGAAEHSLEDLTEWVGSERVALLLMGLGAILGLWKLNTPRTMLDEETAAAMGMEMAAMGYLSVKAS